MGNIKENLIENTMQRKVIYVYEKNYVEEQGFLKVGEASIDRPNANLEDNSDYLISIAEKRIREYEHTSPINILYATYAVTNNTWIPFRDHQVHEVLRRSGVSKVKKGKSTEWFEIDFITVKMAIDAVKQGKSHINIPENSDDKIKINFRPEQEDAIVKTMKVFKKQNEMLWNAKMRFGKTLSALELIRRSHFEKTLIITHRPIVNDGWYEDFNKIFDSSSENSYLYSSKSKGEEINYLLKGENPFVYFASIQDLRGSKIVNKDKGIEKNLELFNIEWDFIIIDEAHEGTTTDQAEEVMNVLQKRKTKILKLSGTPFNLLDDYDESQIYTWDYVMEQEAKLNWDMEHMGDSNPYSSLPEMCMYVYELGKFIDNSEFYDIENSAFNFAEFFKTDENDRFIYDKYVWSFLNLISRSEDYSKDLTYMPFSTTDIRKELSHTLWTLPSISSTKALEGMLKKHPVFQSYNIANLTDESGGDSDLSKIKSAITNNPESTQSITLTVRRGTVGTTVKEWTGILVLNNTESASNYLQSIFRVQSPYTGKDGIKEKAYVFDFAPDRSLKMVSQAAKLNIKAGSINGLGQEIQMTKFLNFLPIIGIDGQKMSQYDVKSMLTQLKRAQAERAVRNGFDDTSIYNDELLRLSDADLSDFANLQKIVGKTNQAKKSEQIDVNKQGLTEEEWEKSEKAISKKSRNLTEEEEKALEKRKELSKQRNTMISILRGISIRIPLMIYGLDIDIEEDVTIDNFVTQVDDISWNEFMPKGISKGEFVKFKKYYDADVFIEAGSRIRRTAKAADSLSVEERIDKIASIFSGFKNPDKETVLTPWRVVNMHMGETVGGYNFFDKSYGEKPAINQDIRFCNNGKITNDVFNTNSKILEINSKTGLYPLYAAFSIYKNRWLTEQETWHKSEWISRNKKLWEEVLENNIYVINKTPMAKTITYRTLIGYESNSKVLSNLIYIDNLTSKIKTDFDKTLDEVNGKLGGVNMKFDVVIGNPPYQENDNGKRDDGAANASASPLYHLFFDLSKKLSSDYISLIFPARWLAGAGKGLGSFSEEMLNDKRIENLTLFRKSNTVFPNTDIKGGVLYLTYNKKFSGEANIKVVNDNANINEFKSYLNSENSGVFIPYGELIKIYKKVDEVENLKKNNLQSIVSTLKPYGLRTDFFRNPAKYNLSPINNQKEKNTDIAIIGLENSKRVIKYIPKEYPIPTGKEYVYSWKLFAGKAIGSGNFGEKVSDFPIGKPGMIATETFIRIGNFKTEQEAVALKKYYHTKFFRALLGILKTTQDASSRVYKYIPLQDFTENSDINWGQTVDKVDEQLFKKYNFNTDEIDFINKNVESM